MRDTQTHPMFLKHLPRKSIIVIHWAKFFLIFMCYYQLRDTNPKFNEKQIKYLIKKILWRFQLCKKFVELLFPPLMLKHLWFPSLIGNIWILKFRLDWWLWVPDTVNCSLGVKRSVNELQKRSLCWYYQIMELSS